MSDGVEPVTFVAITIKLTTLPALTDRFTKVAVELTKECEDGFVRTSFIVKVYDVAYKPPDQEIENPNGVNSLVLIDIGFVGSGGVGIATEIAVDGLEPLEFVAITITLYVIGPYSPVNVAVLFVIERALGTVTTPLNVKL